MRLASTRLRILSSRTLHSKKPTLQPQQRNMSTSLAKLPARLLKHCLSNQAKTLGPFRMRLGLSTEPENKFWSSLRNGQFQRRLSKMQIQYPLLSMIPLGLGVSALWISHQLPHTTMSMSTNRRQYLLLERFRPASSNSFHLASPRPLLWPRGS